MADVAIIYARENRQIVEAIDALLVRRGWTVWWDHYLRGEGFHKEIQGELVKAGCVVVIWSRFSVDKDWVLEEGRFVKEQKRPLVQVRLEKVVVPIGFGQDEFVNLAGWSGNGLHENLARLETRIERCVGQPKKQWDGNRVLSLNVGQKLLTLPSFFCSVSSYETQLRPDAAVRALELTESKSVLASAYDLIQPKFKDRMQAGLRRLRKKDSVVMLDSGNYEAYRKNDRRWNKTTFRKSLELDCFDYAFCYDNLSPPSGIKKNVQDVVSRVKRDQSFSRTGQILPIVHIPTRKGQFHTAAAPDLFQRIAESIRPELIAVPERELGGGIIEKARVVAAIRKELNALGRYQPIHLLGTGNPLSLAVLAAAGADTFDGLEWCRTVADHETGLLYHFQQYDFFRQQTRSAASSIVRAAADTPEVSYSAKVAFHNLEFFRVWVNDLQKDIAHGRVDRLLRDFLPKGFFKELSEALPGVFDK